MLHPANRDTRHGTGARTWTADIVEMRLTM
jgi:hypothetical protein